MEDEVEVADEVLGHARRALREAEEALTTARRTATAAATEATRARERRTQLHSQRERLTTEVEAVDLPRDDQGLAALAEQVATATGRRRPARATEADADRQVAGVAVLEPPPPRATTLLVPGRRCWTGWLASDRQLTNGWPRPNRPRPRHVASTANDCPICAPNSGAARLESLFIDEGFGTLDATTVDVVRTALEELGSTGRMVGVVTHVQALAEQLPVQFHVRMESQSSVVERIDI